MPNSSLLEQVNRNIANLQDQVDGEVSTGFTQGLQHPISYLKATGQRITREQGTLATPTPAPTRRASIWASRGDTLLSLHVAGDTRYPHITSPCQSLPQPSTQRTARVLLTYPNPLSTKEGDTWVLERSRQAVNGRQYEAGTILYATQPSSAFVQAHWVDKLKYASTTELRDSEARQAGVGSYANSKAQLAETKAKAHADGKVTAEKQARITAVQQAVDHSQGTRRSTRSTAENTAGSLCRRQSHEAEKRAIEVAKAQAKLAETTAKAHADGKGNRSRAESYRRSQPASTTTQSQKLRKWTTA